MGKYDWLYEMKEGDTLLIVPPEGVSSKIQAKRVRQRITDHPDLDHKYFKVVMHPGGGVLVHKKRK